MLDPVERAGLRQLLVDRFDLDELKDLAFDLGVDYQLFSHETTRTLARELIAYVERRGELNCLVAEVMKQRSDKSLAQLVTKLPACSPHKEMQIIVSQDLLTDVSELIDEMAMLLKLDRDDVVLIGAAWGSVRLLVGLPAKALNVQAVSRIRDLGDGKCWVVSVDFFESLDPASQKAWRFVAYEKPPARYGGVLRPVASWEEALEATDDVSSNGEMLPETIHCWPHSHIGEALTTNYLRHHLSSGSAVLVNYYLPHPPGTLEIDHVVINHNGVYLLEGKHWTQIEADQVQWRNRCGDPVRSPITSIEHRAKVMHGFLERRGWGHVSVVGLVVLSRKPDEFNCTDPNAHKVFELSESLITALTGREYVFRPTSPTLSSGEVDRLRRVILDNHVAEAQPRIAGYRVLCRRDRGYYIDIEGEDPEFPGHKLRIKQYDVPEVSSTTEIEKAVCRFRRDMAALVKAGPHPNLLMPYKFHCDQSYDERYYLVIEWPRGQTLAERISAGLVDLAEQFCVLKGVAAALVRCHERGVIHRNLTPQAIYLTNDGIVKVGDFDFAKMPAVTRSLSTTGVFPAPGRHASPEVVFNAHDVDARADIYSLGAVWYDMLFRPAADDPLKRKRIARAPISGGGRELLRCMLAEQRKSRIKSMTRVKSRLDKLARDML